MRGRWLRIGAVLAVGALAFGLRWRALERLPIDYDEPWCLHAAQQLALVLRSGELSRLTEVNPTPEHPQLAKLGLALAILPAPESAPSPTRRSVYIGGDVLPEAQLLAARRGAAGLGVLAAMLLAWIQPLAGLFLALHTYVVKFTSQAMIEALPALTSLAAVASWARFSSTQRLGWLAASSVLLGLTAAGKYLYAIVGVAILFDWGLVLRSAPRRAAQLRLALLWGLGSLVVFFAATPWLWPDPLERLRGSVFYLAEFSTGQIVREADFPFWQPLAWLTIYIPNDNPAEQPYLVRIDPLITGLALIGFAPLWRRARVYALWLAISLVFLLAWNTKWPHYIVILAAPLCLAAAEGVRWLLGLARRAAGRVGSRGSASPSA